MGSTPFSFIELPSYLAEKATDVKSSLKIMDKCRGHFLVFGDIRTRQVNGEQHYAIHLEGMVAHAVVASQVSQILANDMRAVLPKRVEIPYKHELRGFEVTSILMSAGARYTIATAALISGALDLSETLLSSLRRERFPVTGSSAKLQKQVASLKKLIPIRLADVYSNQSARWFQQWRSDRSAHALEKVAHYNELCGEIASDRQRYLTFKAILTFVNTRDAEKALSILLNIKGRDTAAHICYSIAFLQAFKGQLDIAERSYQKAFSLDHDGAVAFEVEEFISWIASEYPEKPQLHYCLGLVNLRVKKDPELAARDFSIFLSRLRSDEFAKQVRFATSNLNGRTIDKEAANDSAEPVNVVPMDRHKFQGKSGANSKLKGSGSIS
ncbi:MAG: hypothetical protein ING75_03515 [Rhodocyclaceae bacterium]|nr:hypothetical protein [Rhodocyclaceae bacterium]